MRERRKYPNTWLDGVVASLGRFNNAFKNTVSEDSHHDLFVPKGYVRSYARPGLAAVAAVKFSQSLQRKPTCPPDAPSLTTMTMPSTSFLPKLVVTKDGTGRNLEVDTLSRILSSSEIESLRPEQSYVQCGQVSLSLLPPAEEFMTASFFT